ncbi:MAG: Mu-like prophage major head subunit gpT family protein [Proteobacteria bacterium]|nr:Mu-like prophage major head subunit gpT family protein [Pseudomonadota bacterium]
MALTQAQINALKTVLIARFSKGLAAAPNNWPSVARKIASGAKSNTYEWLSMFPMFREWVSGSRLHKQLKEGAYVVSNRRFETTIDVQRADIEDDSLGQYGELAEAVGYAAIEFQNQLVFQALAAGFTDTCYDGQPFFDEDHPVAPNEDGSGEAVSVSNVQSGTGEPWVLLCTKRAVAPIYLQEREAARFDAVTSSGDFTVFDTDRYSYGGYWRGAAPYGFWQLAFGSKAPLTEASFNAAYDAMFSCKGDGNRVLGIVPDLLVVGPSNRAAAEALIEAQFKANGASNTNYKKVGLLASPFMVNPALQETP